MARRDKGLPTLRELDLITARTVAYQRGVHAGRKAGRAELAAELLAWLGERDRYAEDCASSVETHYQLRKLLLAASAGGDALGGGE